VERPSLPGAVLCVLWTVLVYAVYVLGYVG